MIGAIAVPAGAVALAVTPPVLIPNLAGLVHAAVIAVVRTSIATIAVITTIPVIAAIVAVIAAVISIGSVRAVVAAIVVVAIVVRAAPFFFAFFPLSFLALFPILVTMFPAVAIMIAILRTCLHYAGSAPGNGKSQSPEQTFTEEFHCVSLPPLPIGCAGI